MLSSIIHSKVMVFSEAGDGAVPWMVLERALWCLLRKESCCKLGVLHSLPFHQRCQNGAIALTPCTAWFTRAVVVASSCSCKLQGITNVGYFSTDAIKSVVPTVSTSKSPSDLFLMVTWIFVMLTAGREVKCHYSITLTLSPNIPKLFTSILRRITKCSPQPFREESTLEFKENLIKLEFQMDRFYCTVFVKAKIYIFFVNL